jgi:hypothetical protein
VVVARVHLSSDPGPPSVARFPHFAGRAERAAATTLDVMNPTPIHTPTTRIQAAVDEIFGPVHAPHGTPERRILLARSALAYACLIATLVQVVVWLTIAVLTGHLDSPWWLWTTIPTAAAVVGLSVADRWRTWWSTASVTRPSH